MERVEEKELRKLSHQLGKLYDLGCKKGLTEHVGLSDEEVKVLREVSIPYEQTKLSYPELETVINEYMSNLSGKEMSPNLDALENVANRISVAISTLAIKKDIH